MVLMLEEKGLHLICLSHHLTMSRYLPMSWAAFPANGVKVNRLIFFLKLNFIDR